MNTLKEFSKEVNKITFDFIWNYKPAKIKKATLGLIKKKCNYDYDLLDLNNHLPAFYKQIMFYWLDITKAKPKNKNDPIWNNPLLTVIKTMLFFLQWYQAGIKQISDIFDSCERHFLPPNSVCNKFNAKCSFFTVL